MELADISQLEVAVNGWQTSAEFVNACQNQIEDYRHTEQLTRGYITTLEHERHQKDTLYNAAQEEHARLTEVFNAQRQDRMNILATLFAVNQERRRVEREMNELRPQPEEVLNQQAERHEQVATYIAERNDEGHNYDQHGRDIDPPPIYSQDPQRVNLEGRRSPIAEALAQANRRAAEGEEQMRRMAREQMLYRTRFESLQRDNIALQEHTDGLERELSRHGVNDDEGVPGNNFNRFRRRSPPRSVPGPSIPRSVPGPFIPLERGRQRSRSPEDDERPGLPRKRGRTPEEDRRRRG